MIQSRLDLIDRSLSSPVKENSTPSKSEITCTKVMGAALIVFGIVSVCAFTACLSAAIIMSSAPLAIGAASVGLLGIGILVTSLIAFKKKPEEFLVQGTPVHPLQPLNTNAYVGIVNVSKDQNLRPSVPQKRPSSGKLQAIIPRATSIPTVNVHVQPHVQPGLRDPRQVQIQSHVQPGSRDARHIQTQSHVQPGSRDARQGAFNSHVKVGTR